MSTRHLVDPDLLPFLDAFGTVTFSELNLAEMRKRVLTPVVAAGAVSTSFTRWIPGPPGAPDVRVVIYEPPNATERMGCLVHMHGGGYVIGTADMMEFKYRPLASELGCLVVSVDYRLAPETAFPGAIEDCYATIRWLNDSAEQLGVDSSRIGLIGESAGGGYAAALALLVRDRAEYKLAFQHLISPMLDDRTGTTADSNRNTGEYLWTRTSNVFGWKSLLGQIPSHPGVSCYASASRATDLVGLPSAYIAVGALDLFLDENVDYALRLMRAGVPTEMHVYPGCFHGFEVTEAPVSRKAMSDSVAALRRFF